MIRIGLVGEDPNDTSSIKSLLLKKYSKRVTFSVLAPRIKGYHLDNPKIKKILPIEFKYKKCSFVVYIRDLDGYQTSTAKINQGKSWFKQLDAAINGKGLLLLNIWELEALILADIKTFNTLYGVSYKYTGDPMSQKKPKEELMRITYQNRKMYKESHCPKIFEKLNFEIIKKRCTYFKNFIDDFDKKNQIIVTA